MRIDLKAVVLGLAMLAVLGVGRAAADPKPTNPNENFFVYHLTCDQGYGAIDIVTSNFAAAGQVIGGPGVLVARSIEGVVTDLTTGEVVETFTYTWGRGQKTLHPADLVTCEGSVTFTDTVTLEDGTEEVHTFRTDAVYQMLVLPRRG